jgi:hypothetical protein
MRRWLSWLLAALLLAAIGCSHSEKSSGKDKDKDKPRSGSSQ